MHDLSIRLKYYDAQHVLWSIHCKTEKRSFPHYYVTPFAQRCILLSFKCFSNPVESIAEAHSWRRYSYLFFFFFSNELFRTTFGEAHGPIEVRTMVELTPYAFDGGYLIYCPFTLTLTSYHTEWIHWNLNHLHMSFSLPLSLPSCLYDLSIHGRFFGHVSSHSDSLIPLIHHLLPLLLRNSHACFQ